MMFWVCITNPQPPITTAIQKIAITTMMTDASPGEIYHCSAHCCKIRLNYDGSHVLERLIWHILFLLHCPLQEIRVPFLPVCSSSMCPNWQCCGCHCWGFLTCAHVDECDCTRGLYRHRKRGRTGSWLWEKTFLPHGDSNPRQYCAWLFSRTFYQRSCPRPILPLMYKARPFPPARQHFLTVRKRRENNPNLAVEVMVRLVFVCWLANRGLFLKSWQQIHYCHEKDKAEDEEALMVSIVVEPVIMKLSHLFWRRSNKRRRWCWFWW